MKRDVSPLKNPRPIIAAPPAKAYTLRALVLASLARGSSRIANPLMGDDQKNLINCLRALGAGLSVEKDVVTVEGCSGSFAPTEEVLNAGESGVTMNFLASLAALSSRRVILTGAEGLLKRPVAEVVDGVRQLGGKVEYLGKEGFPPLGITPSALIGGRAVMSGSKTSQYFSSLVITGALTREETALICSDELSEKPYFDITCEMMARFGVETINHDYKEIIIPAGQEFRATDLRVEGDYSSASYLFQAAAVCGSRVTVTGLNRSSHQGDRSVLDILEAMGCRVDWDGDKATLTGGPLKAVTVDMTDIPDLAPTVAATAAFAAGESVLTGVERLRYKECNRLEAIRTNLAALGCRARYDGDTLYVTGAPGELAGGEIDSYNDHRIAMAFGTCGLALDGVTVDNPTCVAKSFPDFWERLALFQSP